MVKQSEQEPKLINLGDEEPTTRRAFVKALVGTAAAGFVVAGCSERAESVEVAPSILDSDTFAQDTTQDDESEVTLDQPELSGFAATRELTQNPDIYKNRPSPDEMRELIEESEELFRESFYILRHQATSPVYFPMYWVNRFRDLLVTGMTETEVEQHLIAATKSPDDKIKAEQAYLAEMSDKYDLLTYQGISGISLYEDDGETLVPDDTFRKHEGFKIYSQSQRAMRGRFFRHAYATGNLNETADVRLINSDPGDTLDSGRYSTKMNLQITNDIGDGDQTRKPFDIEGVILLGVNPVERGDNIVSSTFSIQDEYQGPFREIAGLN